MYYTQQLASVSTHASAVQSVVDQNVLCITEDAIGTRLTLPAIAAGVKLDRHKFKRM